MQGRHSYGSESYGIYRDKRGGGAASLLGGILIGAAFMYLLDSGRGAQRRSYLRGKLTSARNLIGHRASGQLKNLGNHLRGSVMEARSRWRDRMRTFPDEILVERVRAQIGHVVSHPRALEVEAEDGWVCVSGGVLPGERERIEHRLRQTRGVRESRLMLTEYETADELSRAISPAGEAGPEGDRDLDTLGGRIAG